MRFTTLVAVVWFTATALPAQDADLRALEAKAREALGAGQYAEAVSLYTDLVDRIPDVAGLQMNLGVALFNAGRYQEALPHLKTAAETDPDLSPSFLFLGATYLELGQPENAIAPLRTYIVREPKDPSPRQMLATLFTNLNRQREAADQFEALTALTPGDPRAWYGLARAYEALVAEAFEAVDRAASESAWWFALLADSRLSQQQYRSAFFFYRKALEKKPDMRGIHIVLAQIYRKSGHADWADAEEQKELELGLPDCAKEKVVCAYLEGKLSEALAQVRDNQTPESSYWQAQIYNRLAVDAFARLAALPRSFEGHQMLAEIYSSRGQYLEASQEWEKALELSPGNRLSQQQLALALYRRGDFERVTPMVTSLLKDDPRSPLLNFLAGDILLGQEKAEEAIPQLEKALQLDPEMVAVRTSLGRAYLTVGQPQKAIPHLKAVLARDEDGSIHYQLSRAYQGAGERELARETLQKYQEIQRKLNRELQQLEEEVQITPP